FLCDFECSDDDEAADHKEAFSSKCDDNNCGPTGLEDSGVEIGLESEQEGQVLNSEVPVLFLSDGNKLEEEAAVEVLFGGSSVIEDKDPVNNASNYLQDAENFPPLGSLQAQNDERSRKRRRKRRQHQRSGDVPCSSSEDSDREKSPASLIDRSSRVRSSSGVAGAEKSSGVGDGGGEAPTCKSSTKKIDEAQESKTKEGHDTSSTDSKSTTETVLTAGDTSSSSAQSDVDLRSNKVTVAVSKSDSEITPKVTKPPVSSWADLFRNSSPKQTGAKSAVAPVMAPVGAGKENNVSKVEEPAPSVIVVGEDKRASRIAVALKNIKLDYSQKPVFLRGLINKANWCYINAVSFLCTTLQALLACPPFYNLLSQIEPLKNKDSTSTPIMDSMVRFSQEFNILPKSATQSKNGKVEFRTGSSFEPNYVYKMLSTIQSSLSSKYNKGFKLSHVFFISKGRQEDAEEFLSCILNGIHEEMLQVMKLLEPAKAEHPSPEQPASDNPSIVAVNGQDIDENDDNGDWEQVGPRNKSSITRMANFPHSLMSEMFGGYLRSSLHQAGAKESANVEPFFDLQLDIQNVNCIEDALNHLAVKEELQGYTCSKTNSQIDISRRVTFESLPKVLILHLKRFIYSKSGSQKLLKHVDYPLELVIGKVVYHHGKTACGGHYTADVHHLTHGWVRADDTKLKVVPVNHVLKPIQGKDPYLLYYYRTDQIA
ncbi:hypothetical protein QZH41_010727, partial [Actinostola sp. cb2023]